MPSEWKLTTLGSICESQGGTIQTGPFGSQLHTSDYKHTGVPVVMPTNIGDGGIVEDGIARIGQPDVERLAQHKLRLGDIVFSRRGDVTKNALVHSREVGWLCGTGCLKVRLGNELSANAKFISYCLRMPETKEWLVRHAVGATMPNLNTSILSAVPIRLPPLRIQSEIASMLGALDHKIALLRETNATLEAIAQALFKSWFVDFDPVRAKAEGRDPEGVPPEVADLFPSEFEDSELGEIPKGWRVKPFADTVEILSGGTPKTSEPSYWGGSIPWFSVVDAPPLGQVFTVATEKSVTGLGIQNSSARVMPAWTTVISARGTVGKLALTGVEMAMNQSCYGLVSKTVGGEVLTYLAAQRLVDTLKRLAHGGVFDTITRATLASVNVCEPPSQLVTAFDAVAHPIFERILANNLQVLALTDLRDTLLPRLMTSKLRIPQEATPL